MQSENSLRALKQEDTGWYNVAWIQVMCVLQQSGTEITLLWQAGMRESPRGNGHKVKLPVSSGKYSSFCDCLLLNNQGDQGCWLPYRIFANSAFCAEDSDVGKTTWYLTMRLPCCPGDLDKGIPLPLQASTIQSQLPYSHRLQNVLSAMHFRGLQ